MVIGEQLMAALMLVTTTLFLQDGNGIKENTITVRDGTAGYLAIFGVHIFTMVRGTRHMAVQTTEIMAVIRRDGSLAKTEVSITTRVIGIVGFRQILTGNFFTMAVGIQRMEIPGPITMRIQEDGNKIKGNTTIVLVGTADSQVTIKENIFTTENG